jgi:hypothetical protein
MKGPITITPFSIAITAGTPADLVTPASGEKVRLLGYHVSPSAAGTVLFKDGGAADALVLRTPALAINTPDQCDQLPGDGMLLSAANGKLRLDAGATGTITGWVATSGE